MTRTEEFVARWLARRGMRQGWHFLCELFIVLAEAAEKEFTEDNATTRDAFLKDALAEALRTRPL